MPRHPVPLPADLGEVFTRGAAIDEGVTVRRLRAKDLETPFRGVRLRAAAAAGLETDESERPFSRDLALRTTVMKKAHAYAKIMPAHAFFTGRTAAVVWRAHLGHGHDLDVAVHAPARAPRRRGIRARQVEPRLATVREHFGLRLSSPASTWAMLGSELTVRELVALGDAFVRVPRDARGILRPAARIATIDELRRAAAVGPRKGSPRLRSALELIRVGSASPLESDYRFDAAAAGLPEPELDVEIFGSLGVRIGISDVVHRAFRVIVEVEGDHHRTTRAQWNRDIEKYAAYAAEGWEVVRLTSAHIRGAHPRATAMVRDALVRRGWRAD